MINKIMVVLAAALLLVVGCATKNYANDVPTASMVTRVFPGDLTTPMVYAEAMSLTDLNPAMIAKYTASFKLAAVQRNKRHQQVLIAVAINWKVNEKTANPVAARYGDQFESVKVTDIQLLELYRQVLIEQGLATGQEKRDDDKSPDIWLVLYPST